MEQRLSAICEQSDRQRLAVSVNPARGKDDIALR
jgi:hypothetical protein